MFCVTFCHQYKFFILSLLILVTGSERKNALPDDCGKTRTDGITNERIIDGEKAELGMVPWIVRLGRSNYRTKVTSFLCGGSLINRYFVLTAAHCREGYCDIVRVGENYISHIIDCDNSGLCAPPHQDIRIKRFVDPNYCVNTMENDIALVELRQPVKLNDFVQPVCLPFSRFSSSDLTAEPLLISGWGIIKSNPRTVSEYLMYIYAPLINRTVCNSVFTYELEETQLCIGYESGKDSCNGDSGGPVTKFVEEDGIRRGYLVGIVSYGLRHCGNGPAVYTNVAAFANWTREMMNY